MTANKIKLPEIQFDADNNLVITPSYQYYATTIMPASSEYDLQISYN